MPENNEILDALTKELGTNSFRAVQMSGNLSQPLPTLTNLQNTLMVSSHGGPSGFTPDTSDTNALAKAVRNRVENESGKGLSLEEIAGALQGATNDVKRVIISACFAAGYDYPQVKKLFPNLQQLVAPSEAKPTSASFDADLVYEKPSWAQHQAKELSPFFNITPSGTNVITKASDWLKGEELAKVQTPLPEREQKLYKEFGAARTPSPWHTGQEQYSTFFKPRELQKAYDQVLADHRSKLRAAKNSKEIDAVDAETTKRLQAVFDEFKSK